MYENHTLAPRKKALLVILVVIMAIAASFLTYRKNKTDALTGNLGQSVQSVADQKGNDQSQIAKSKPSLGPDVYSDEQALNKTTLSIENIIWFTNYYRVKNKLSVLRTSKALDDSAYSKTLDMFTYHYFDHIRPAIGGISGRADLEYFVRLENYDFLKVGENLAQGNFSSSKEVVEAWMQSPPHRKNILDPKYTQIGVSIQTGVMDGKSTTLITEHFGEPSSVCPSVDQSIKTKIDALNKQLVVSQADLDAHKAVFASGGTLNDPTYEAAVEEYNALADSYNILVKKLTGLTATYNGQVKLFDECLNR